MKFHKSKMLLEGPRFIKEGFGYFEFTARYKGVPKAKVVSCVKATSLIIPTFLGARPNPKASENLMKTKEGLEGQMKMVIERTPEKRVKK